MDKSWIEVGSRAGKGLKGGSRAGKKVEKGWAKGR